MKISGFTMCKNADKLFYPIKEAIASILPIVDEFVVALGNCDEDDHTRERILELDDPKIKIIDTVWDIKKYSRGTENAHQTNIARKHCTGDWLFYVQADEVVHEKFLPKIKQRCQDLLDDKSVEGLLFKYKHFWGDFEHYQEAHSWYKNEIRIVRNHPDIHSWESAQSFRRIPDFDEVDYRQQKGTYKLHVARSGAEIYHYGWVRPPYLMKNKMKALDTIHKGKTKAEEIALGNRNFDYGPMDRVEKFEGTHPKVMQEWVTKFNWKDELQLSGKISKSRKLHKHEKPRYRIASWIENNILGGRTIGGFKNYILLEK